MEPSARTFVIISFTFSPPSTGVNSPSFIPVSPPRPHAAAAVAFERGIDKSRGDVTILESRKRRRPGIGRLAAVGDEPIDIAHDVAERVGPGFLVSARQMRIRRSPQRPSATGPWPVSRSPRRGGQSTARSAAPVATSPMRGRRSLRTTGRSCARGTPGRPTRSLWRRRRSGRGSSRDPRSGRRTLPADRRRSSQRPRAGASGLNRVPTTVVRSARTETIRRPTTCCTRSNQWEPMSPTAPLLPPFSGSRRHEKSVGCSSQSCR